MVYTMVYTTCREPGPVVASWYIPWYIPFLWYIPWYIPFFSVIYHGITGFDLFLRHGTYQFFGYMARYVSIFWVCSIAQDGMYRGEGGIYLWYIAKVVYTIWGMYHTKYDTYDVSKV